MRKSLFSSVIKGRNLKEPGIKSYAMREMNLPSGMEGERDLSLISSSDVPAASKKIDQLLAEIREREKYIKQMTDKTHNL